MDGWMDGWMDWMGWMDGCQLLHLNFGGVGLFVGHHSSIQSQRAPHSTQFEEGLNQQHPNGDVVFAIYKKTCKSYWYVYIYPIQRSSSQ